MTTHEAQAVATKLGLSTWVAQVVAAGDSSESLTVKRVGFASIDFALGEGETWEQALSMAMQVIFSA